MFVKTSPASMLPDALCKKATCGQYTEIGGSNSAGNGVHVICSIVLYQEQCHRSASLRSSLILLHARAGTELRLIDS